MAGTQKVMRTELNNGMVVSTVQFNYNGTYQTMAFNNANDMDEVDCHETDDYNIAIEAHMNMVKQYNTYEDVRTEQEVQTEKFVQGGVYETRSICDSDCIFSFKVEKVTEKTVVITDKFGKSRRCKIHTDNNRQFIYPMGVYSMCPIIRSTDLVG